MITEGFDSFAPGAELIHLARRNSDIPGRTSRSFASRRSSVMVLRVNRVLCKSLPAMLLETLDAILSICQPGRSCESLWKIENLGK